jgi:Lipase (class 3)
MLKQAFSCLGIVAADAPKVAAVTTLLREIFQDDDADVGLATGDKATGSLRSLARRGRLGALRDGLVSGGLQWPSSLTLAGQADIRRAVAAAVLSFDAYYAIDSRSGALRWTNDGLVTVRSWSKREGPPAPANWRALDTLCAGQDDQDAAPAGPEATLNLAGLERHAEVYHMGLDVLASVWLDAASKLVVVAFRGTVHENGLASRNFAVDGAAVLRPWAGPAGLVHAGFRDGHAALATTLQEVVSSLAIGGGWSLHCVGHSLGGALATLYGFTAAETFPGSVACTTFGCPRCGDATFASAYDAAVPDTLRVVDAADCVPMVPLGPYVHVAQTPADMAPPGSPRLLHLGLRGNLISPKDEKTRLEAHLSLLVELPASLALHLEDAYFDTLRAAITLRGCRDLLRRSRTSNKLVVRGSVRRASETKGDAR